MTRHKYVHYGKKGFRGEILHNPHLYSWALAGGFEEPTLQMRSNPLEIEHDIHSGLWWYKPQKILGSTRPQTCVLVHFEHQIQHFYDRDDA